MRGGPSSRGLAARRVGADCPLRARVLTHAVPMTLHTVLALRAEGLEALASMSIQALEKLLGLGALSRTLGVPVEPRARGPVDDG